VKIIRHIKPAYLSLSLMHTHTHNLENNFLCISAISVFLTQFRTYTHTYHSLFVPVHSSFTIDLKPFSIQAGFFHSQVFVAIEQSVILFWHQIPSKSKKARTFEISLRKKILLLKCLVSTLKAKYEIKII